MSNPSMTEQLESFFSNYSACSFKAGEVLLYSGQPANTIYYLKSGIVQQTAISVDGQELSLTLYKPGAFFPLVWAVHHKPCPYDLKAITNGHGWKAPAEVVIEFLKREPTVAFELATRLLSGLEGMSRKLEFALQGSAIARLAEALLTLAYRFGENSLGVNAEVTIELELTHQQLAEMTGLNRETVTRHLMMLRHQGLIEVDKHHYRIPNLSALEKLVLMPIEE